MVIDMQKKAYKIISGGDVESICFTENKAQAKWNVVLAMREAGVLGPREWPELRITRARQYDKIANGWKKFPGRDLRSLAPWALDAMMLGLNDEENNES